MIGMWEYKVMSWTCFVAKYDDVIKWKHFPRYWPIVRGIHRSPMDSPHKSPRRRALMLSLLCTWTNGSASNRNPGGLRRHCAHYDVIVMKAYQRQLNEWRHVFETYIDEYIFGYMNKFYNIITITLSLGKPLRVQQQEYFRLSARITILK